MTSVSDARHAEHVLEGLGEMGVAQMQHKMVAVAPMLAVATILPTLLPIIVLVLVGCGCGMWGDAFGVYVLFCDVLVDGGKIQRLRTDAILS